MLESIRKRRGWFIDQPYIGQTSSRSHNILTNFEDMILHFQIHAKYFKAHQNQKTRGHSDPPKLMKDTQAQTGIKVLHLSESRKYGFLIKNVDISLAFYLRYP